MRGRVTSSRRDDREAFSPAAPNLLLAGTLEIRHRKPLRRSRNRIIPCPLQRLPYCLSCMIWLNWI